jgi:hypothetical protein
MYIHNKHSVLIYSTFVILWWLCIWGLFEEFIHRISNKNPMNKVIIYISIIFIIIGITYQIPETLEKF